ncbi:MAG: hypothetical protein WC211_07245 [Dehalococcoidia bacterium]
MERVRRIALRLVRRVLACGSCGLVAFAVTWAALWLGWAPRLDARVVLVAAACVGVLTPFAIDVAARQLGVTGDLSDRYEDHR